MSRWLIASEEPKGTVNESNYSKTHTDNIDTVSQSGVNIIPNQVIENNPGYSPKDTKPAESTNKSLIDPAYTNNDSLTNL